MGPWSPSARGGRALERGDRPLRLSQEHDLWLAQGRARQRPQGSGVMPRRRDVHVSWQARQVLRWVNGKNPRQYGFDIGLWTRHIVHEVGETAILSALESSLKRRGACPTKSDIAEATAPRLPMRFPSDGALAARDLPHDLTPNQVGRRRNLLLERVGRWRQCGLWNDVGAKGHRSDQCPASAEHQRHVGPRAVRAKVSELGSRRTCVLLLRLQMTVDGSLGKTREKFRLNPEHLPERALHSAAWH